MSGPCSRGWMSDSSMRGSDTRTKHQESRLRRRSRCNDETTKRTSTKPTTVESQSSEMCESSGQHRVCETDSTNKTARKSARGKEHRRRMKAHRRTRSHWVDPKTRRSGRTRRRTATGNRRRERERGAREPFGSSIPHFSFFPVLPFRLSVIGRKWARGHVLYPDAGAGADREPDLGYRLSVESGPAGTFFIPTRGPAPTGSRTLRCS